MKLKNEPAMTTQNLFEAPAEHPKPAKAPKSPKVPKAPKQKVVNFAGPNGEVNACGEVTCQLVQRFMVPFGGDIEACPVVVVGFAPGCSEELKKAPLAGNAADFLFAELRNLGVETQDCYRTHLVKCRAGFDKVKQEELEPDAKVRKICWERHADEREKFRGKVVVLLGAAVVRAYLGEALGTVRGHVIEKDGVTYLPVYAPGYVMNVPESIYTWRKDLGVIPSLVRKIRGGGTRSVNYTLVATPTGLAEMKREALAWESMAFDLETNGLDPFVPDAKIICCGISNGSETFVIDVENLSPDLCRPHLQEIFNKVPTIAQNAKFDMLWIRQVMSVRVPRIFFDTAVAKYLLDEGTGSSVGLKQMVWKYFPEFGGYDAEIKRDDIANADRAKLAQYNAADAFLTHKIYERLDAEIRMKDLDFLFDEVLMPAIRAFHEIEFNGMFIDIPLIQHESGVLTSKVAAVLEEIKNDPVVQTITDFNPDSPHSLRKLFFDKLGLVPTAKTAKGSPALTKETLAEIAASGNPIATKIHGYKHDKKMLKTYFQNYSEMAHEGLLHPNYNLTASKGGRPACGHPNVQNVPYDVRKVFRSRRPGGILMNADFKAIELRVLAIVSGDQQLIKMFRDGQDPHTTVGATIFGVEMDQVTKEMRRRAKTVNFGLVYGMGPKTLAARENVTVDEAKYFLNAYFTKFQGVKAWQDKQRWLAEHNQLVSSPFGRTWDMSGYKGEDRVKRAFNFPIQSTASDINIMCLAMIQDLIFELGLDVLVIGSVHDSQVYDLMPDAVESLQQVIRAVVADLPSILPWQTVPMETEMEIGTNWSMIEVAAPVVEDDLENEEPADDTISEASEAN